MNFNLYKIIFVSFIMFIVLSGCSIWEEEPLAPPTCPIQNLMIDISIFTPGWIQGSLPSKRNAPIEWGVDKLGVSFTTQKHGGALQDVYRGRNFDQTEKGYIDLSESWFHLREDEGDWHVPPEFSYESPIANHYRFGCSIHQPSGFQTCQMSAQYGVYVMRFYAGMSPMMTYEDLERILREIDNKVERCFDGTIEGEVAGW